MDVVQQASRPRSREHPYVVPLRDLDAGALSLAGGKAANLGELTRASIPVPPGFVVTADTYFRFVQQNGLEPAIKKDLFNECRRWRYATSFQYAIHQAGGASGDGRGH